MVYPAIAEFPPVFRSKYKFNSPNLVQHSHLLHILQQESPSLAQHRQIALHPVKKAV
jgi:hypothetical protein